MSIKGAMIAGVVASLFSGGAALAKGKDGADKGGSDKQVKCMGVNECKGKAACNTADHGCAGENSCKGKGWIKISEKDCKAKKGTVLTD